jgi:hypothetical protein
MYAPQHWPGLNIGLVMEEKLVLATTGAESHLTDYVYMDWGPDLCSPRNHFLDVHQISLSPCLSYILATGGWCISD